MPASCPGPMVKPRLTPKRIFTCVSLCLVAYVPQHSTAVFSARDVVRDAASAAVARFNVNRDWRSVYMGSGCVIDEQTQQFGPTVMSARVHEGLTFVNQRKVQIADHLSFTRAQGLTEQLPLRSDDRGEAATRDRAHRTTGVGRNLPLLIRIQPSRRGNHEDARLEGMIAHLNFGLLREQVAEDRSGEHRGMDLLAIGYQRVSGQRVVVLPTGQLTDATHRAVHRSKSAAIPLPPYHPFVIRGGDLPPTLDQCSVSVEKQLSVEQ